MSNANGNGETHSQGNEDGRVPRRVVLLADGEDSTVARVLAEFRGAAVSGKRLHEEVQRFAAEHRGRHVAAEWLGPLGWVRFLWCRR